MSKFVHLHNHSDFSLQDAAAAVKSIVAAAAKYDMKAVALTDHGVMYGIPKFYKAAKDKNIKAIVGMEAYITLDESRFEKKVQPPAMPGQKKKKPYHHLILLAKNKTGYQNLAKLSSLGFLEGYYYRPRIDWELLEKHHEGLICTSACLGGVISSFLVNDNYEKAKDTAQRFQNLFGDDFYLELQDHFMPEDQIVLEKVPQLSKELGIKMVATNDCHYVNKEDAYAHNILLLMGDKTGEADYRQLRYHTDQIYFKSQEEMTELFSKYEGAVENTLEITDKIDFKLDSKGYYFPDFPIPAEFPEKNLDAYFEHLSREKLKELFGENPGDVVQERFEYELNTIRDMGFSGYFLIVQDFIAAARGLGIPVGPGRGSAAGSLIAYVLGITKINPLEYDLLFERFLNPARRSMPDIDVDFADEGRGEVIEYVKRKYGADSVSQIITFTTLSSKAVIRDVARVLDIPLFTVNNITKHIPSIFGKVYKIEEALEKVPELKWINTTSDEKIKNLIKYGKVLEGMNRNASKHAAGVVITPGPVMNLVPLAVVGSSAGDIVTQYSMKELEENGLLKMDFLGLRTLSIIEDTLKFIRENRPKEQWIDDIDKIPFDDEKAYKIFWNGQTTGIFQFESAPMRKYLKKLKPVSVKDLSAMNALYRPGPMAFIDDFIDRRFGRKRIEYLHPVLEPILKETYGIIVYQEQVIQIANKMGGMSLADADLLRRAMGKKDAAEMQKQKDKFIEGSVARSIPRDVAVKMFDLIEQFANYGFNKSHSVAYSYLAYQTAYLKAHFTEEFIAANLTHEVNDLDKVALFLEDCRKFGIKVLTPDVNSPTVYFKVEKGRIRFGLSAIKNVGVGAVEEIIRARKELGRDFKDIFEFVYKVDLRIVNKRALEGLVLAGAFSGLYRNRKELFNNIEMLINYGSKVRDAVESMAGGLFGDSFDENSVTKPELAAFDDWSREENLKNEREVMGFYMSGHPMHQYELEDRSFSNIEHIEDIAETGMDNIRVCGIINNLETRMDKKGNRMAIFALNGLRGTFECMMFASVYEKYYNVVTPENPVILSGKAEPTGDVVKIMADEAIPLNTARKNLVKFLRISVENDNNVINNLEKLKQYVSAGNGGVPLMIELLEPEEEGYMRVRKFISRKYNVDVNSTAIDKIAGIFGEDHLFLVPGKQ